MLVKKDFFSRKKTFNLDLDPVILSPDPEPLFVTTKGELASNFSNRSRKNAGKKGFF